MGEVIDKPIFRQNFDSIEFGANIKSECIESGFISTEDVCTVGLYGFFNGSTNKIIERQSYFFVLNISLFKIYKFS